MIDVKTFITVWQKAESLAEVKTALAIPGTNACKRASYLRKQGIPLQCFQRGPRGHYYDFDELKNLALSLRQT